LIRIAASILNADFSFLADQIQLAQEAGVDWIHLDVMDGLFVPNLSMGFPILEAARRSTSLPLDVHLMIERPERFVTAFADAGATYLTVHQESTVQLYRTIDEIRRHGMRPGVALRPATPLAGVEEIIAEVDLLLVMTIEPGFGGQELIPATLQKVSRARQMLTRLGSRAALEVDGGIKSHNAADATRAGADVLVIGTGIFQAAGGIGAGVAALRAALGESS
jgi:ribulose-phosphate 3-epimerase